MSCAREYVCDDCGATFGLESAESLCRRCGGLLEVRYDLSSLAPSLRARAAAERPGTIWRWRELLPLPAGATEISLGEGDTPLLPCPRLAARTGAGKLWVKNDGHMPTGSFKDRGFSVAVSMALTYGIRRAVTYSSGNAGASLAAYGARAGLEVAVLAEYLCNPVKLATIQAYGARVLTVHFESTGEIFDSLQRLRDLVPYTFVNFLNPVRHEAMKTYAYEICEALGWRAPDVMIHPVGTGGGLYGAWKGFKELYELGWVRSLPRMIAVQPTACAPIVRAIEAGALAADRDGDPSRTIAQSIAGDTPIQGGRRVIAAIRESGGAAVAVDDDELREAMALLGAEGILAEPSAAAPVAALRKCLRDGSASPSDEVVCVVTGSGLKQPSELAYARPPSPPIEVHADPASIAEGLVRLWGGPVPAGVAQPKAAEPAGTGREGGCEA